MAWAESGTVARLATVVAAAAKNLVKELFGNFLGGVRSFSFVYVNHE